jgi:hypothetical protein
VDFTVPPGWFRVNKTDSLNYGIASGKIYRLNADNFTYTLLYTLPAAADVYNFRHVPGKLIVVASNRTNPSTETSINVNQIFYFFADPPNGAFKLLGKFEINSTLPTTTETNNDRYLIPFFTSPTFGQLAVVFKPGAGA